MQDSPDADRAGHGAAAMLVMAAVTFLQAGCMMNSVTAVPPGTQQVRAGHSILVFGVGLDARWDAPTFRVQLDEYDLAKQKAAGDCWHFNRMQALVPSEPGSVRYFAFDVPAGHYALSTFAAGRGLEGGPQAFAAPSGQVVYAGDFIYTANRSLALRHTMEAAQASLASISPETARRLSAAAAVAITSSPGILCTP